MFNFAVSVSVPAAANTVEIREGSTISAVYIEMWITSDDATAGTTIVTLEKKGGTAVNMTAANSALLNSYANKNQVFHTQMGLTPTNIQYPMASIKGWFKIPKGKQRFSIGDRLSLNIHGQSNGVSACGFILYKEQY